MGVIGDGGGMGGPMASVFVSRAVVFTPSEPARAAGASAAVWAAAIAVDDETDPSMRVTTSASTARTAIVGGTTTAILTLRAAARVLTSAVSAPSVVVRAAVVRALVLLHSRRTSNVRALGWPSDRRWSGCSACCPTVIRRRALARATVHEEVEAAQIVARSAVAMRP